MIRRSQGERVLLVAGLAAGTLFVFLPLYWMGSSALKTDAEITASPPTLAPEAPATENFRAVWRPLLRPGVNSLIVSGSCTVLIVVFRTMAGYVLAKKRFAGRNAVTALIVGTMLIPPSVLIVPLYCLIVSIGLGDTLTGLVLPFAVTAFGIFLMRQFAAGIPDELLESAHLDGCSEWTIFWRVIVPLLRGPMAVLAIIEFVNNWNAFTVPFVLIHSPEKRTLQLALADIRMASEITPWGEVMAAATLTVVPVIILFLIFQRRILRSAVSGALKG